MAGACGSCTACCRVFSVPAAGKFNAHDWCKHCEIGVGCKIYADRPRDCVEFQCLWLQSQDKPKSVMPPEMRPDKCKVVIATTTHPKIFSFTTLPGYPTAWRHGKILDLITKLAQNGYHVVAGPPGSTRRTLISASPLDGLTLVEKEQRMTEPDAQGMQWNIKEGEENATRTRKV